MATATSSSALRLSWATPTIGANPILNYTVSWGSSADDLTHSASLKPNQTSVTAVSGVPPNSTVFSRGVTALNLHWFSNMTAGATVLSAGSGESVAFSESGLPGPGYLVCQRVRGAIARSRTAVHAPPSQQC